MSSPAEPSPSPAGRTAFLFDLDGTLVDSVYQHVLAWREALEKAGMELSVWRIHRRIGMSGGLLLNALLREMEVTPNSGQCNHGRPTYVELKLTDIERLFGRR